MGCVVHRALHPGLVHSSHSPVVQSRGRLGRELAQVTTSYGQTTIFNPAIQLQSHTRFAHGENNSGAPLITEG